VTESYQRGPPLSLSPSLSESFIKSNDAEEKHVQARRGRKAEVDPDSLRTHHRSIYHSAKQPAQDLSDLLKTVELADIPTVTSSQVKRALVCPRGKLCSFVASGKSKGTSKTVEYTVKKILSGLFFSLI
jgi:hypothetical protein